MAEIELERLNNVINSVHSEKNNWQWRAQALEKNVNYLNHLLVDSQNSQNSINAEKNQLQWRAETLQRHIERLTELKMNNRLVEFDYPYAPARRDWSNIQGSNLYKKLLDEGVGRYERWLADFSDFRRNFLDIAYEHPSDEAEPFWSNEWFAPLDGIAHYGLLARTNPKIYLEVGSGNSTKFARRAIKDHGLRTKIISIDPFPRAVIDDLCDEVIRTGLELCDLSIFSNLDRGDIVFIDNSHRSFQNSDVTVFFTEVLPTLNSGTLWSVHDIFLPHDYPGEWLGRFYNEQYLLMTYLFGGAAGDTIEIPVAYISQSPDLMASFTAALGASPPWGKTPLVGGSFWMHKN